MKKSKRSFFLIVICLILSLCANGAFAKNAQLPPETTHDGLVIFKNSRADLVYILPGVDLSGYEKIILYEPHIAFRKHWKNEYNSSHRMDFSHISNKDMERMIERGKDLFTHAFTDVLEDGGYPIVKDKGDDVLEVRPAIIDLDVKAPDPDRIAGAGTNRVYTASAGSATLIIELFDSVTGQILVRAIDRKIDSENAMSWHMPRTTASNQADANRALRHWAKMLKDALDESKTLKSE